MPSSKNYDRVVTLLSESETLALSVIDNDHYPVIYPMEKVKSLNLEQVIFITKKEANKVRFLKNTNRCCVEVHTEEDMVCLRGFIEIYEHEDDKQKLLPKYYLDRLEKHDSSRYCVLVFHTLNVSVYIDNSFECWDVTE